MIVLKKAQFVDALNPPPFDTTNAPLLTLRQTEDS
jgi:hypothetical protein